MKAKTLLYVIPALYLATAVPQNQIKSQENVRNSKNIEMMTKSDTLQNSKKEKFIENARSYIGMDWAWGGRDTKKHPGIDCMGIIFKPYAKAFNENWKEYSVYPSKLIENKTFGKPVKGLDGILSQKIDKSKLETGDIIYFLRKDIPNNSKPVKEINGKDYEVGHMGIYTNKEKNLVLNAFGLGTKVKEDDFDFLTKRLFEGIYVSRPDW